MKRALAGPFTRLPQWGTFIHLVLASIFLVAVASGTVSNVRRILDNPSLGTRYVYTHHADLIQEIERVQPPTKETVVNLTLGVQVIFSGFFLNVLVFQWPNITALPDKQLVVPPTKN